MSIDHSCYSIFFINLVSNINNKTKEWHMSQEEMLNHIYGIKSYSTLNSYLNLLEELKLIYVHRPNRRKVDGTFHAVNNSYGRYRDKEKVVLEANKYLDTIETQAISTNINRGAIRQRFNAFDKDSKKYKDNIDLVVQLYKDCIAYNKSLSVNPIEDKKNDYKPVNLIDMSKFKEYGLVEEKDNVDDIWGSCNDMFDTEVS